LSRKRKKRKDIKRDERSNAPFYFFDNNAISTFYRKGGERKLNQFETDLSNLNLHSEYVKSEFVVTPFSFLEAIGVKLPTSKSIKHNPSKLVDIIKEINPLFENPEFKVDGNIIDEFRLDLLLKYEKFLYSTIILQQHALIHTSQNQLFYVSPSLREDFKSKFLLGIEDKEGYELLINRLALDRMYNYFINPRDFPGSSKEFKNFLTWMHSTYLADVVINVKNKQNIPQIRGLKHLWNTYKREMIGLYPKITDCNKVSRSILAKNIKFTSKCMSLKDNKDLVDIELVHAACIGRWKKNKLRVVNCVTSDPYEKILVRISLYKALVFHAIDAIKKERKFLKKICQGRFIIIERTTGKITDVIEVSEVPKLLDIISNTIIHSR